MLHSNSKDVEGHSHVVDETVRVVVNGRMENNIEKCYGLFIFIMLLIYINRI
jgi:hypothetical protein